MIPASTHRPPLVSIIINNYNYGRFLREAIESALNQTPGLAEVILVDDGFGDFEVNRFVDVCAGGRDTATEAQTHGGAVLKRTHLSNGGKGDEE